MHHLFTDPRCLAHAAPPGYPERPERLRAILDHARTAGWTLSEDARGTDVAPAVEALHDAGYLARFERAVARGDGLLDSADNPLSAATWDAAWGAAEAAVQAADRVVAGSIRRAFVAVRPPGHHAERAAAMGFCYLGNVSIAAQHLIAAHGCRRLAIVDFDVHHGNGTQHLFESRGDVLVVNLHQYPFYPGTGAAGERGTGAGEGATCNLPLPAGTGDDGYAEAFTASVLPAVRRFRPEMLLVSAGFDAWQHDPLGGMRLTAAGFRAFGGWLRLLAEELTGGRLLSVLEGGYDVAALPALVTAYLDGVEGLDGVEKMADGVS